MRHIRLALLVLGVIAAADLPVGAQTRPPRPQGDAVASLGWLAAKDPRPSRYSRRWAHALFGNVAAGWYWTDHLKSEVGIGAGTEGHVYLNQPLQIDGREVWQNIDVRVSRRTVGISQQYQYGRNAWFHPYVGAGVHLTWERRTERFAPLVIYAPTAPPQILREARTEGPQTRFIARPFVVTGFKGYLTPRAFFQGELRLGFRGGLDESAARAGFGFDF